MSIITDMDIANPENIPEETEWVESETNTGLEGVITLEKRYERLEELVGKAYHARDKTSLTAIRKEPEVRAISLEGYIGTITQKNVLATELSKRTEVAKSEYTAALEDYVSDIEEDFGDKLKAYEKVHTKLRTTDADIEVPEKKNVQVNHTRVFEMFHVKETFQGKEALNTIRKEDTNIARLVTMVGTGVARIKKDINDLGRDGKLDRKGKDLPDLPRMFLMFNRRAEVKDGQYEHTDKATKKPKKSFNWKQHVVVAIGAFFFGHIGAQAAKDFQTKRENEAKVDTNLADIHRFIRYVEGFEDSIDDLTQHVDELIKLFSKIDESNKSALNRRAAPVLELAEFIVKHVTDITRGTDTLFSRLVRKN